MVHLTLAEAPEASLALSWSVVVVSMVAFSALIAMLPGLAAYRRAHGSATCDQQKQKGGGEREQPNAGSTVTVPHKDPRGVAFVAGGPGKYFVSR